MSRNVLLIVEDPVLRTILSKNYNIITLPLGEVPENSLLASVDAYPLQVHTLRRKVAILSPDFTDIKIRHVDKAHEIKLNGTSLKSIVATGSILEGEPILVEGDIRICCKINSTIVCSCKVLVTYLLTDRELVLRELYLLHDYLISHLGEGSRDIDNVVKILRDIIISERRKYKLSKTLSLLRELSMGKTDALEKIPTHVLDVLVEAGILDLSSRRVNTDALRMLLRKLEKHVYAR